MSRPQTTFVQRAGLMAWLVDSDGLPRQTVEKWLREEVIQPHSFPGLRKQPKRRVYCVATVIATLGLPTQTDP